MNADIYALCEVGEGRTAVQDIVNGLNEAEGTDKYAYIDSGDSHESTYTKNVFVYNTTKVTPYKEFRTIGSYLKLRHVAQAFDLKENQERKLGKKTLKKERLITLQTKTGPHTAEACGSVLL